MTRILEQDMTYHQLVSQLYSGKPYVMSEFAAAKELWRRGYANTLSRAAVIAKRRTSRAAATWPEKNRHLMTLI